MARRIWLSAIIGIITTLVLLGLAYVSSKFGMNNLARAIFWQNQALQALVPLHNIGTAERPIYEGTPINFFAFLCSIPFGFLIYGGIAYAFLRHKQHSP